MTLQYLHGAASLTSQSVSLQFLSDIRFVLFPSHYSCLSSSLFQQLQELIVLIPWLLEIQIKKSLWLDREYRPVVELPQQHKAFIQSSALPGIETKPSEIMVVYKLIKLNTPASFSSAAFQVDKSPSSGPDCSPWTKSNNSLRNLPGSIKQCFHLLVGYRENCQIFQAMVPYFQAFPFLFFENPYPQSQGTQPLPPDGPSLSRWSSKPLNGRLTNGSGHLLIPREHQHLFCLHFEGKNTLYLCSLTSPGSTTLKFHCKA